MLPFSEIEFILKRVDVPIRKSLHPDVINESLSESPIFFDEILDLDPLASVGEFKRVLGGTDHSMGGSL